MTQTQCAIPVTLTLISLGADNALLHRCPTCAQPMHLHRPERESPDRMLWTCVHCSSWFLMDIVPGRLEAILVCLPDHGHFRAAMGR